EITRQRYWANIAIETARFDKKQQIEQRHQAKSNIKDTDTDSVISDKMHQEESDIFFTNLYQDQQIVDPDEYQKPYISPTMSELNIGESSYSQQELIPSPSPRYSTNTSPMHTRTASIHSTEDTNDFSQLDTSLHPITIVPTKPKSFGEKLSDTFSTATSYLPRFSKKKTISDLRQTAMKDSAVTQIKEEGSQVSPEEQEFYRNRKISFNQKHKEPEQSSSIIIETTKGKERSNEEQVKEIWEVPSEDHKYSLPSGSNIEYRITGHDNQSHELSLPINEQSEQSSLYQSEEILPELKPTSERPSTPIPSKTNNQYGYQKELDFIELQYKPIKMTGKTIKMHNALKHIPNAIQRHIIPTIGKGTPIFTNKTHIIKPYM
ncbi:7517_t:CDS:1, partial [Ambispora leptoticha]